MAGFYFLVCICLVGSVFKSGYGLSSGPPGSTCFTRYPKHKGTDARQEAGPYVIQFNSRNYVPNANTEVTIGSRSNEEFKGFQIAAYRIRGNSQEIVGRFIQVPTDKGKTMSCFGGVNNMAAHANAEPVTRVTLTWQSPAQYVGTVRFKASIVSNFSVFWVNLEEDLPQSDPSAAAVAPTYPGHPLIPAMDPVNIEGCGDRKSCFLYPLHCDGNDCIAAVSFEYRNKTDDFLVEMFTDAGQNYVGLAFSDDKKMGQDETIICVAGDDGRNSVQHGYSPAYFNDRLLNRYISSPSVRHADGRIECRFVMPRVTEVYRVNQTAARNGVFSYNDITFHKNEGWYVQLAWGRSMGGSDVITRHKDMPVSTNHKAVLSNNEELRGTGFHVLVRAHAALMMVAWIFLSGIVTVVSRHYRSWLPRRTICDTKMWFQVHRNIACMVVVLTGIGLALIFSHYGVPIRKAADPHAFVGLAVTAGVGVQAILGFIRPAPDGQFRFIFNWVHRFLGQACHILAAVTMFLAFDIEYITKDMRNFGFITLGVWVGVQVLWHIAFEIYGCRVKRDEDQYAVDGKSHDGGGNHSAVLSFLLAIYITCLAGCCVAAMLAFLFF